MTTRDARPTAGRGTGADVLVVGNGVAGLTTAVLLAESGARVRVWAREPALRTTSAVAGALWEPYRVAPQHRVDPWARESFEVFARLAADPDRTGVRMVAGLQAAPAGGDPVEQPSWASFVPGLRHAEPRELPPGYGSGLRAVLPLIDMPHYLGHLTDRLRAAGGSVEERAVRGLDEAVAAAPTVVNCTGLGARDLLPGDPVRPVRGQLVVVENPGITEWFIDADKYRDDTAYFFPQPYGLLLGGTAQQDDWRTAPDPATAEQIVRRCARIDPRIAGAAVLAHRVGLRPVRDEVRLEREGAVVHNYGHGGAGVTVSWGCAAEAAALAVG